VFEVVGGCYNSNHGEQYLHGRKSIVKKHYASSAFIAVIWVIIITINTISCSILIIGLVPKCKGVHRIEDE